METLIKEERGVNERKLRSVGVEKETTRRPTLGNVDFNLLVKPWFIWNRQVVSLASNSGECLRRVCLQSD